MIGTVIDQLVALRYVIAIVLLLVLAAELFYQRVLSETAAGRDRARALRWRVQLRLSPRAGYASLAERLAHWSRLSAVFHGRRARPGLGLFARLTCPGTEVAVRLGRGPHGRRLWARLEDHVLGIGPPRSFKSARQADRVIDHPGAVVTTSTRPDVYTLTIAQRRDLGDVYTFNPDQVPGVPPTSFQFPLLEACRDPRSAHRMAVWLAGPSSDDGNLEWFEQRGDVALAGLLYAAAISGRTVSDVFRWIQRDNLTHAYGALAGWPEALAIVRRAQDDNRMAASIRGTMQAALEWCLDPALAAFAQPARGAIGFDVARFVLGRGTLYLIARGDGRSLIAPLFRAIVSHIHYQATLLACGQPRARLDPPLLFALDEVTQICPVDLPHMLADSAGYGLLFDVIAHSFSQLEYTWGEHGAATVWSLCGTKMAFGGVTADTADKMSALCPAVRAGDGAESSAAPPAFIRMLPDRWALVVRTNFKPAIIRVRPAWKRPENRIPLRWYTQAAVWPTGPQVPQPRPIPEPDTDLAPAGAVDDPAATATAPVITGPWPGTGTVQRPGTWQPGQAQELTDEESS